MEEDIYLLKHPIHINKFKKFDLMSEENAHVLSNLIVTIDGTICGVKPAAVAAHLKDPEVRKMRVGAIRIPASFKVLNEDDFYRFLSILVPLDY